MSAAVAVVLVIGFVMLSGLALGDHAWVAGALLGGIALLLIGRAWLEIAMGMAMLLQGIDPRVAPQTGITAPVTPLAGDALHVRAAAEPSRTRHGDLV